MPLSDTQFIAENHELIKSDKRIILAYSGGLDSSVLLYLLAGSVNHNRLLIWHINHQLQDCSTQMEVFCREQVAQYRLTYKLSRLNLSHIKSNVESQARNARYAEFVRESNHITDVLLTAHHADDQLETLLLNMCRGTGVLGLRGVAEQLSINNLNCLRPLLNYSRADLNQFAHQNNILWMDDPSNDLDCFDRNYIRHEIAPKLKKRWPSVTQSFLQVASHQKEAAECLESLALIDFETCKLISLFSSKTTFLITKIQRLSLPRKKNLLRYWLSINSVSMSLKQMDLLIHLIMNNKLEFKKHEFGNHFVALFKGELFLVLSTDIAEERQVLAWLDEHDKYYVCRLNNHQKNVSSHFLKRQYQSAGIPPWLRDQTIFKLNENGSKHNLEVIML